MPAPHPTEFRRRAVELARLGEQPIAALAKQREKKELGQLRRDKRRLEMENNILTRAAAYFARENTLPH